VGVDASPETLPHADLMPDIYRFAILMTGCTAKSSQVLQASVERASRGLREIRDAKRARRWLFSQARADCGTVRGPVPRMPGAHDAPAAEADLPDFPASGVSPAPEIAGAFAGLPEPERCALALFYLYLFSPLELAEVLEIKPRALPEVLIRGRAMLRQQDMLLDAPLGAASASPS
jgi:DNA-directed RNA polymerase specialized sigma24 family protein